MTNVVTLKAGAPIQGIVPQNLDEIFRLAKGIAASGLAPRDMSTPEKVMVAIMTGLEIGLPPMFAVQKIAVINGRPSLWGDAVPALLWSKGFKLREWTEGTVAHCEITRPDGTKIERTFSDEDAKRAGLLGKSGPWTQYRERMRQMRARGFAARDGAADVLGGMYLREEIDAPEMKDVTPAAKSTPSLPDIPDIPDPAEPPPVAVEAPAEETQIDVEEFLSDLRSEREWCTSEQELQELRDARIDVINALPAAARTRALKILDLEE